MKQKQFSEGYFYQCNPTSSNKRNINKQPNFTSNTTGKE